jgi:hypothetical protein
MFVSKFLAGAKVLFWAALIVSSIDAAFAAPPTPQQQPKVFTPACAVRPRCGDNACLRMGRCSVGSHTQPMGCLIYSCKHGGH